MAENTKIEWADHTFNPWEGCQKVGPGCDHCYAEARNLRYAEKGATAAPNWGPGAPRRRTSASNWAKPLRWAREAETFHVEHGRRQRVFCASLADVFDNAVDPSWRADLFALILGTPELDWLLLTKRIGNVTAMLHEIGISRLPDNVWLGATIVNQEEADRDIGKLAAVPASVRFLSMEPLLGPVELGLELLYQPCPNWGDHGPPQDPETGAYECCSECNFTGIGDELAINWVIVGGESGPGARPMNPAWAISLRDQCAAAGVPFLFKQWGDWAIEEIRGHPKDNTHWFSAPGACYSMLRIGKHRAGRLLEGRTHDGFPQP